MRNKSFLDILAIASMMSATTGAQFGEERSSLTPEQIDVTPKQLKPAKGCKEYFFNKNGGFTNAEDGQRRMRRDETVFYCHATNDKNAKRKFEKWLKMEAAV